MTKTLTEKWKDGELDEGWYYVVREGDDEIRMLYFEGDYFLDTDVPLDNDNIKEVLSAVPSYVQYKGLMDDSKELDKAYDKINLLEKRFEIATKALKDYADSDEWELVDGKSVYWSRKRFPYPWRIAGKALKEMKGVK